MVQWILKLCMFYSFNYVQKLSLHSLTFVNDLKLTTVADLPSLWCRLCFKSVTLTCDLSDPSSPSVLLVVGD